MKHTLPIACRRSSHLILMMFACALLLLLLLLLPTRDVQAQWSVNGNDISNTNTGNVGVGTSTPAHKLDLQAGSLPAGKSALSVVGTLAGTSGNLFGESHVFTTSTGSPTNIAGSYFQLSPGYTGSRHTQVVRGANVVAGTSTEFGVGNIGVWGTSEAPTTGNNIGTLGWGNGGNLNYGIFGYSAYPKDNSTNIGVAGFGINTGASPIHIGGYFGLQNSLPAYTSAALIADNGGTTDPVFLGRVNGAVKFTLNASGNVGIGTTSPGVALEVAQNKAIRLGNANLSSGGDYVHIGNHGWYNGSAWQLDGTVGGLYQISGQTHNWYKHDGLGTFTNMMTINASGNVGVGTPTPAYKLDVNGEINATGLRINGTPVSSGTSQWITSGSNIYYSTGSTGIGTASPEQVLHVNGNSEILSTGTGAGYKFRNRGSSSSTDDWVWYSNGNVARFWRAGLGDVMGITTTGNVGIGTITPTAKLDVTGNVNVSDTITGGNIVAKYQDVAEWVPASQAIPAGTVVVLDPTKSNHVRPSSQGYDTRVAGVVSVKPGVVLGEGGEDKVMVATTGRVKVKVDATRAPIGVGDLLVTSNIPGVAMKSEPVNIGGVQLHRPGTLIGKALEPLAKGEGEILVLLSLQ